MIPEKILNNYLKKKLVKHKSKWLVFFILNDLCLVECENESGHTKKVVKLSNDKIRIPPKVLKFKVIHSSDSDESIFLCILMSENLIVVRRTREKFTTVLRESKIENFHVSFQDANSNEGSGSI